MIYSQPPKLPYTLVFILSICHHISQAISHFPCPVGCLRLLWVDFQALRLSSSYILFDSLESTALHPDTSLPSFSQSHWCFPSCKIPLQLFVVLQASGHRALSGGSTIDLFRRDGGIGPFCLWFSVLPALPALSFPLRLSSPFR